MKIETQGWRPLHEMSWEERLAAARAACTEYRLEQFANPDAVTLEGGTFEGWTVSNLHKLRRQLEAMH